jgi:hypothetical protein
MRAWVALGCGLWLACAPTTSAEPTPSPSDDLALVVSNSELSTGPVPLLFGDTVRGGATVFLSAPGATRPIEVIAVASAPVSLVTDAEPQQSLSFTLEPGELRAVRLGLELTRWGYAEGLVHFRAVEPGVTPARVLLTGYAVDAPSCLDVDPTALDFELMNTGCPVRRRSFLLRNRCFHAVLVSPPRIEPETAPFVMSEFVTFTRRVEPGSVVPLTVEFRGGELGAHEAELVLPIVNEPPLRVRLTGERTNEAPRSWRFEMERPEFDLLVVMDTTADFKARWPDAGAQVASDLINPSWYGAPLRVGIASLGASTLAMANGKSEFDNWEVGYPENITTALGSLGTGPDEERCLDTVASLISSSLWRPYSRRLAVCVTDAPDQSVDPNGAIAFLQQFNIQYAVVGPSGPVAGCNVEGWDDGVHAGATSVLRGQLVSLCGPWSTPKLSEPRFQSNKFQLPDTPNFPIVVFKDQLQLTTNDWHYHPDTRSIEVIGLPEFELTVVESVACPP